MGQQTGRTGDHWDEHDWDENTGSYEEVAHEARDEARKASWLTRLTNWIDEDVSALLSPRATGWVVGSALALTGFAAGCGVMAIGVAMGVDRAPQQVIVVPAVPGAGDVLPEPDTRADCGTGCHLDDRLDEPPARTVDRAVRAAAVVE